MKAAIFRLLRLVPALGILGAACSADFEPSASIEGLRVFGVVVDTPYAKPGTSANLSMVYYDNSPLAIKDGVRRDVQILWIGGCVNPAGDDYFGCYPILAQQLGALASAATGSGGGSSAASVLANLPPGVLGTGDTFTVPVPADIITSRPPPRGTTAYGLEYVFWVACGGNIGFDPTASGLPIKCTDVDTGATLGAQDFVIGYTPIYAYDTFTDANPVITGASFDGKPYVQTDCTQASDCDAQSKCGDQGVCIPVVPHCASTTAGGCPQHQFQPSMDPSVAELDPNAQDASGHTLEESIWILYYATDGTFTKDARLVNDPTTGWNSDYGTNWMPPGTTAGEARIWGIVHDNRGGTGVWFQDVYVE